ncbi:MAG: anaerobic ribonucleoside-triphosphate reductase [Anaerotignaceae bacterium]
MINVNVINGSIDKAEIDNYIKFGKEKYPYREITGMEVNLDGEFVDLKYSFKKAAPFEHIRRITGYLVGTTDRWNNAKKAEEQDRVKHGM